MVQITKVEYDRKEKHRYKIFVNNDHIEPLMSVHEDVMIKFRLLKGREIHREELQQIAEEDTVHRAYALALSYLSIRPRTNMELIRYLSRKGLDEHACERAIVRLEQERLIDDASYANRFAEERLRNQKKGRKLLQQELRMRGIAKETASEAIARLDEEEEQQAANHAACKKWPRIKGEPIERKRKLTAFLMRRGFPGNVIKKAIQAAVDHEENELERHMLDN